MLTSLCGSETREQSRHRAVAKTKEMALFVKEMKEGVAQGPQQQEQGATASIGAAEDGVISFFQRQQIQGKGATLSSKQHKVDATLTITSTDSKMNTWLGFKSQGALYLRGNGWNDMDIREVRKIRRNYRAAWSGCKLLSYWHILESLIEPLKKCF